MMKSVVKESLLLLILLFVACDSTQSSENVEAVVDECVNLNLEGICPLNTSPKVSTVAQNSCTDELTISEGEYTSVCVSSGECSVQCEVIEPCDGTFMVTREAVTCVSQAIVEECMIEEGELANLCPENTTLDVSSVSTNECQVNMSEGVICSSVSGCSFSCVESCGELGVQEITEDSVTCQPEPSCGDGSCDGPEGREDSRFYCDVDCRQDCTPMQTRCEGELLARCNAQGQWEAATACPAEQRCRETDSAECVLITPEVCDNLDNDFDGRVDEELIRDYEVQTGICRGATQVCSEGAWGSPMNDNEQFSLFYEGQESTCDQVDNDCDGVTDNDPVTGETLCCQSPECTGVEWVSIPGGTFMRGSDDEMIFTSGETPVRMVTVAGFEMMKSEVTTAMFRACVLSGNCEAPSTFIDSNYYIDSTTTENVNQLPINGVTWSEALRFCQWMGGDLPSEAQWEYAARRGHGGIFPWEGGPNSLSCARAHLYYECDLDVQWEINVCSKPAGHTVDGLCDMIGNVSEWVKDDSTPTYDDHPTDGSAYCETDCNRYPYKITRGGSVREPFSEGTWQWRLNTAVGRYRGRDRPESGVGFRCMR